MKKNNAANADRNKRQETLSKGAWRVKICE